MHDVRRLYPHQLWRAVGIGALGCLVHLPLMALENMPPRLDKFNVWSNGNVVSTRYAHDAAAGAIKHAQRSALTGMAAVDGVLLGKNIAVNTKNGLVTATATQRISARQIGKALASVVRVPGPVGLALLAAPAILSLVGDAGLQVQDGQIVKETGIPVGYDGHEYREQNAGGATWYKTRQQACEAHAAGLYGGPTGNYYVCAGLAPIAQWQYFSVQLKTPAGANVGTPQDRLFVRRTDPSPPVVEYDPASVQDIEDAIAQVSPSPEALRDLVEIGDVVPQPDPADQPTLSNVQPSPKKTSTKTLPDGSTETTECEVIGILSGLDIRLSEECTTTMRDPSGNPTGTTSTSTDADNPEPSRDQEEEKSPFCELFPKALACAELGTPEGDAIPREERSVSYTPEVLFGSGSCPADTTFTSKGMTVTIGNWSSWCGYITTYLRPMVLLLAAFAAFMIVAKGTTE